MLKKHDVLFTASHRKHSDQDSCNCDTNGCSYYIPTNVLAAQENIVQLIINNTEAVEKVLD